MPTSPRMPRQRRGIKPPLCKGGPALTAKQVPLGCIAPHTAQRCHSEPVTDVTGVGIRSPFHANRRPKAATYLCRFAAKARFDNRLTKGAGVSKEGGPQPSLFGRFKEGGFSRGKGNRNPFPLEWRFWLLLSLLTKVTRRRHPAPGRGTPLPFGKESIPP